MKTQSFTVLPLKPGAGPYMIAMHATPTARDFFPDNFYRFQNRFRVFPALAVANTGSCVGPQTETGQRAHRYRQN